MFLREKIASCQIIKVKPINSFGVMVSPLQKRELLLKKHSFFLNKIKSSVRAGIDEQVFSAILLQLLSLHLHVKLFFCKFTCSNKKFWRRK